MARGRTTAQRENITGIARGCYDPQSLVIKTNGKHKDIQGILAAAKEKPGSIKIGVAHMASIDHVASYALGKAAGVEFEFVPFDGGGEITGHRHPDFLASVNWSEEDLLSPVMHPDERDTPDPAIGVPTQLYHWTAIAYESVMLGAFMIHFGPKNETCAKGGFPKTTNINIGFCRDGVTWLRSPKRPFIGASRQPGRSGGRLAGRLIKRRSIAGTSREGCCP